MTFTCPCCFAQISIDAPRIREGFRRLFPTLRKWPVPAQLIEQIPGRPLRASLPAPPLTLADQEAGKQKFAELKARLAAGMELP